jgi:hypothetical protein
MNAIIVDDDHGRTATIYSLNVGIHKIIVYRTRQMGGVKGGIDLPSSD